MKKILLLAFLVISLVCSHSFAAKTTVTALTNLASGKVAYGTFSNTGLVTDGKIKGLSASSADLTDTPQYLTINLGKGAYLDRVKVYFDADAYSNDFAVRTSTDAKYWNEEAANVDAGKGVLDANGKMTISISLKKSIDSSQFVQIMIPAGTKVSNKSGNVVRISEVEVFPAIGLKFTIDKTGEYAVTDNSCIVKYNTSIGAASGTVKFGTNATNLDNATGNSESGAENSVVFYNLKPRTTYFYQITATDYYGNTATSKISSFTTAAENIALNKKVSGTFTNLPADKYVKSGSNDEILARVTDGKTSYFTSMALSGPVPDADQYVVIDLGRSYKINNIISYWRKLAYPENLTVQVSDNNSNWVTVAEGINVGGGGFARSDAGDPMKVINTAGANGRYIKILVTKGSPFFHKHGGWNYVELMEVKAFGE